MILADLATAVAAALAAAAAAAGAAAAAVVLHAVVCNGARSFPAAVANARGQDSMAESLPHKHCSSPR